jgi:hypothetical protein
VISLLLQMKGKRVPSLFLPFFVSFWGNLYICPIFLFLSC